MTLYFWNEDKTKIRNIGGSDMNYDEFFNELQERYPEDNIVERLIEHAKEQDAEYAKEAIEHKQRQQKYAEETKQIEQEVRAYFGSAYSEDEIKRQIYYRWQRAQQEKK